MRYILLSDAAEHRFSKKLTDNGFTPIFLPPDNRLNPIVASHADTLICKIGSRLIINEKYCDSIPQMLHRHFTMVPDYPHGEYPTDTAFNALAVRQLLFARSASLSPAIKAAACELGIELVNVNQGYACCSVLALPFCGCAITADIGMACKMEERGIDVLRIQSGHIALEGCEYGFIGGASFVCEGNQGEKPLVYFLGDIDSHPDGKAICEFLRIHGCGCISLGGELTDYGGAVITNI